MTPTPHAASPLLALLPLLAFACAAAPAPRGQVREGTPDPVNLALARARERPPPFVWEEWSAEAFARARRERRPILVDCAAEWCHWCHVMDETSYLDPGVGQLLRERFVAIRVDVDARPDIAERYVDWGWPATILLSPDAEELGKYRGYLPPEQLRDLLQRTAEAPTASAAAPPEEPFGTPDSLPRALRLALRQLDAAYDPEEGGWGTHNKAALGANVELELRRAARGEARARERALFTLAQQRALIDPVWGGLYQYSAASHWRAPHFEKLLTWQTPNIEALAQAYQRTGDAAWRTDAERLVSYLETFLGAPDGTFYTAQDADVGAHDRSGPFIDGHVYYALGDADRRRLGVPWVDTHVYARENGLAISALLVLHGATGDARLLARARQAADRLLSTHVDAEGNVRHDAALRSGPRYLVDAAALGRALVLLAQATGETSYRESAVRIARALVRDLTDPASGAFWESTPDGDAAGVFSRRLRPLTGNVSAARFLLALSRLTGRPEPAAQARRALAAVATPGRIAAEGRMVGELLLALDEAGVR